MPFQADILTVCAECLASFQLIFKDGHDRCLSCLSIEHLRQGLSSDACMNCSCMTVAERTARLAGMEDGIAGSHLPPSGMAAGPAPRRCGLDPADVPSRKRRKKEDPLASRVDTLALEFAEIKAFLLNLQLVSAQATEFPTPAEPVSQFECFSRLPSTTTSPSRTRMLPKCQTTSFQVRMRKQRPPLRSLRPTQELLSVPLKDRRPVQPQSGQL